MSPGTPIEDPFSDAESPAPTPTAVSPGERDPFEDLETPTPSPTATTAPEGENNFFFKKEFFILYTNNSSDVDWLIGSVGGEVYRRFSSPTRDIGDMDVQLRLVRYQPLSMLRGWNKIEIHNAYFTAYNPFGGAGYFNLRAGHFDQPYGLEPETDTHGTLLQLSSNYDFGFKKDWGVEAFGVITPDINYYLAYTRGSGMDYRTTGRPGMFWSRLVTSSKVQRETNSQFGLSYASGKRLPGMDHFQPISMNLHMPEDMVTRTQRYGADFRWNRDPYVLSLEGALGKDDFYNVRTFLGQFDYVDPGSKWQASLQYRNFYKNNPMFTVKRDRSLTVEFDWYFRKTLATTDVIRFNYTRYFSRIGSHPANVWMMHYYLFY